MGVNCYQPHVLIIPEDEANSSLANGFQLEMPNVRRMQILPVAGGWRLVVSQFCSVHVSPMIRYPDRSVILALDLDGNIDRLQQVKEQIPENLRERVYVLSVLSEPEELSRQTGRRLEELGADMAKGCDEPDQSLWNHTLLSHNIPEIRRMKDNGLVELLLST